MHYPQGSGDGNQCQQQSGDPPVTESDPVSGMFFAYEKPAVFQIDLSCAACYDKGRKTKYKTTGEKTMDRTYDLNELAMMSGLTTRTLRNYLNMGLLEGNKVNGVWQFTVEDIERFFAEPFVKEGMRSKRSSVVFDFLADRKKKDARTCVILDRPASVGEGSNLSAFFCKQMETARDVQFNYLWDNGHIRVILSGAEKEVGRILQAYYAEN